MDNSDPRLNIVHEGDVTLVDLMDQKILDEASIAQIGGKLFALVAEQDKPRLVLDFARVAHMSSSALGMLITLHKRIREKDGRFALCNISSTIIEVFKITKLDQVFTIAEGRQAAWNEVGA